MNGGTEEHTKPAKTPTTGGTSTLVLMKAFARNSATFVRDCHEPPPGGTGSSVSVAGVTGASTATTIAATIVSRDPPSRQRRQVPR